VNFAKEVGRGCYAAVYEAEWRGLSCVVKVFHDTIVPNKSAIKWKQHEREVQIMQAIRHPNIVQLLGFVTDPLSNILSIVMERMHDTLTATLVKYSILPFDLQVNILHDVAVGLNFLHTHTRPIIHRDLCSNNILLTTNLVAKVSDLGLAKHLKSSEIEAGSETGFGTQVYMPPEILGTIPPKVSPKTDIFSFGVVTLQVATGKDPEVTGTINADAEKDRRHHHISLLSDNNPLHSLIVQCLNNESSRRPSAQFLCKALCKFTTAKESIMELRREKDTSHGGNLIDHCDCSKSQNDDYKKQTKLEKDKLLKEVNDLVCIPMFY